jgi:hypothetical protein
MRALLRDLRIRLVGYPLVVPDDVIAYHARKSGLGERAIRAAFRARPPGWQHTVALMTDLERAARR